MSSPDDPTTPAREMRDPPSETEREARLREDLDALRLPPDVEPGATQRRSWGRWLLVAVLVLGAGSLLWRALARGPLRVETATATALGEAAREPVPVLSGSGYLVPAQPFIAVGSRVAGRIERYLVDEGDRVKAGDALVVLEARPFQATVDQVGASLASARSRRQLAESELRRARELFERGVLARETLDRRESEARVARSTVNELEASLRRAEIDLEDAVIRAPTDGVVLETYKQPGEIAVPGGFSGSGDLLRLANLAELRAELDVNESDLTRVSLGQAAQVVPDAFPDARYAGRVVELAPQIDRQKGTREVEVVVLEPDERLLPDMSVRVVFLVDLDGGAPDAAPSGAVVVPRGALRRDEGGRPFLWVVRGDQARKVSVEVGETVGDKVVISSGLEEGASVVVGTPPESDGQRVERATPPAPAAAHVVPDRPSV